jgi:uncharacterized membrane protein
MSGRHKVNSRNMASSVDYPFPRFESEAKFNSQNQNGVYSKYKTMLKNIISSNRNNFMK